LLNTQDFTWGWFQGGFRPTQVIAGVAKCGAQSVGLPGTVNDYIPHHEPFQYFPGTKNPHHLAPTGLVGTTDQANHQYDLQDFFSVLSAGQLPAVSFVKAKAVNDGHPGNSDPLDEQEYLVSIINKIQLSPQWKNTAIIIAYDDSDGWYDHVMPPVMTPSATSIDPLAGPGACGTPQPGADAARCGRGPRQPLLVISPWAKPNFVGHTLTDQVSVLRFIEENWDLGFIDGPVAPPAGTGSVDRYTGSLLNMFDFDDRPDTRPLILDPVTGTATHHG